MSEEKSKKPVEWKRNKPPEMKPIVKGYGLRQKDLIKSLDTYNKATFAGDNEDIKKSLEWTKYLATLNMLSRKSSKFEKHRGFGRDYPGTPMIDKDFTLLDGEKEALNKFRDKKPFSADKQEWLDMVQELFLDLAKVHEHQAPAVMHTGIWEYTKGVSSFYTPHVVVLTGAKSVITALHEYTHSIGYGEVVAVWWSTNAFRLTFPSAFEKLESHPDVPHLMRKIRPPEPETADMTEEVTEEVAEPTPEPVACPMSS